MALCALLVVLGVAVWFLAGSPRIGSGGKGESASNSEDQKEDETQDASDDTPTKEELIAQADALAMTYDYDGAISLLQNTEGDDRSGYDREDFGVYRSEKCLRQSGYQPGDTRILPFVGCRPSKAFFQR